MDDTIKKLEARIVELEQRLGEMPRRPEPADISADELKAYQKVKAHISADWGDECGLNECMRCIPASFRCYRCIPASFRCIWRCINECGPIINRGVDLGSLRGGLDEFGMFGG